VELKQHIESLFRYLNSYEKDYGSFETEAFIQTYNGITAVFKTLRSHRDDAVETDYAFLDFIQSSPLTSSDLRRLTVQTMISYFEAQADVDGRSNQAYLYVRNLRSVKQDVQFIEQHLIPLLFRPGSLNANFRLHSFFLVELAKYLNEYGPTLPRDLSPEEFDRLGDDLKFLTLCRRRLQFGTTLVSERIDPEFHLHRVGSFRKLAAKDKILGAYLSEWQYLGGGDGFWSRVAKWLSGLGAKGKGFFTSLDYSRLVFRQRRPALVFNVFMIVVWLALDILAPKLWWNFSEKKLDDLNKRKDAVNSLLKE